MARAAGKRGLLTCAVLRELPAAGPKHGEAPRCAPRPHREMAAQHS